MCECSCSWIQPDFVFTPKDSKSTVCLTVYPGCSNCADVIGVDVRLFDPKGVREWLDGNKGDSVEGDEYGHVPSLECIPILSIKSLKQAVREMELPDVEDYESLVDWLDDNGLRLLQKAIGLEMREFYARRKTP